MDDANQILSQNQTDVQTQPQAQTPQGQKQPQNQQQPQGGGGGTLVKERELPVGGIEKTGYGVAEIRPSEPLIKIDRELTDIGVKEVPPQVPELDKQAQKAGISLVKESVPVPTQPLGIVKLAQELEAEGADKKNTSYSSHWLLAVLKKVLKNFKVIN